MSYSRGRPSDLSSKSAERSKSVDERRVVQQPEESHKRSMWTAGHEKTHSLNWPIHHERMSGEMLSEYLTKVSVIHLNSISVDFIDRPARTEQRGNQLNLNVSLVCQNSAFSAVSVPRSDITAALRLYSPLMRQKDAQPL